MRNEPMLRKTGDKDMQLPEGKNCGDCFFFLRCSKIYGHIAQDEVCDWLPSQFQICSPLPPQVKIKELKR
ncbi:MAG: hypothetical protein WC479_07390 [Candidatus Izemoplasmatales bacterium]